METPEPSQAEKDAARRAQRLLWLCMAVGIGLPAILIVLHGLGHLP